MSSGASCRKLNPREGESNCNDENTEIGENAARMFDLRDREDPRYVAKVSMHGAEARPKSRQSLPRLFERFFVAIDTQHLRVAGCFQNCFAMPAQAYRAIDKHPAPRHCEQLDRLSK